MLLQQNRSIARQAVCDHPPQGKTALRREHSSNPDERFSRLVGERAWNGLPPEVQARFSGTHQSIRLYSGRVMATELSPAGRLLAFVTRVLGAPLPLHNRATGPAVVSVTEDPEMGGQIWSRSYARPGRFPQVVHSAKRFSGPTGLEEYVGAGLSMSLAVTVEDGILVFRSQDYFLSVAGWRILLPRWLSPGQMQIEHEQIEGRRFWFTLRLDHCVFGRIVYQKAWFEDTD